MALFGNHQSKSARHHDDNVFQSMARYTSFVFFSKVSLGALALVMIATVILIPLISSDDAELRIAFDEVAERDESLPLMMKPVFQGVDEKNQPYTITADSALQKNDDVIVLDNIEADLFTEEQNWLALKADTGTLDNAKEYLTLVGNVELYHDKGYEVHTPQVAIDMKTNEVSGEKSILLRGLLGTLESETFHMENKGETMVFEKNVKMVIRGKNG